MPLQYGASLWDEECTVPKLIYTVEERVYEEDFKYYPAIHVWCGQHHIYGYRFEVWFDSYTDAYSVARMAGKEEMERIKQATECWKEKITNEKI